MHTFPKNDSHERICRFDSLFQLMNHVFSSRYYQILYDINFANLPILLKDISLHSHSVNRPNFL